MARSRTEGLDAGPPPDRHASGTGRHAGPAQRGQLCQEEKGAAGELFFV